MIEAIERHTDRIMMTYYDNKNLILLCGMQDTVIIEIDGTSMVFEYNKPINLNIKNTELIDIIKSLVYVMNDIHHAQNIKPRNYDYVISNKGCVGLFYNDLVYCKFDNHDYCIAMRYTNEALIPKNHITGLINMNYVRDSIFKKKVHYLFFNEGNSITSISCKHKPGHIYINRWCIEAKSCYLILYLGEGQLIDVQNLNSQQGYVYIPFAINTIINDPDNVECNDLDFCKRFIKEQTQFTKHDIIINNLKNPQVFINGRCNTELTHIQAIINPKTHHRIFDCATMNVKFLFYPEEEVYKNDLRTICNK